MKACTGLFLAMALGATPVSARRSKVAVTPVQKVVQLMEGMLAKGKSGKQDEQVQFAAYKQFCEDTATEKTRSIAEAKETMDMLEANIAKYTADAARLAREIAGHDEDITVWTGDIKAATTVRSFEKNDFDKLHKDYSESVDALQRAIAVLKKQAYDRSQASLAQVSALQGLSLIPTEAKKAIETFLAQDPQDHLAVSAPEAHGYEFQSHGVIDILEKLLDKFIAERTDIEKEEMNTKHAFDMLIQDMDAQIAQATQDRGEKAETKAKKLQAKADDEGNLQDTTTTREADMKYLADLTATCEQKATDYESRQQLRADEIEAINKAIDIIASDAVRGHAATYLPALMQKGHSFAALRSDTQENARTQLVTYLKEQASRLNSRVLSSVAQHAADDPFRKVKKLIKDLLIRLMEEATEEAEHKGWCDTELSTNEQTRKQKTEAVETLHAEIDELETSIAKLTEDLTELTKAVADLDSAMADATQLRHDEKAKNAKTVADSHEAQAALAQALIVLKEFYAKAGDATAFVQQQPVAPEIFDSPYKGMQAENGGVVAMLEVIQSDFARLEADTSAAEETAQQEYDTFMTDSKVDKAAKNQDIEHKTAKRQDESQGLVVKRSDVEGTQKELNAALDYFDKLKPSCVDAGVSYDDRVGRRKEEIQSLQEALRILNGEDLA